MGEKSDKVKYESGHLKNYIKIQIELWINIFRRLRFRSGIFEMDPWYLSLQVYMSVLIFIIPISVAILYFSVIYSEKSQRKKTGSMEYPSGEHDRLSGIYFSTLFQTSDRFFPER